MNKKKEFWKIIKYTSVLIVVTLGLFVLWQVTKPVPTTGDWKDTPKVLSTAQFNGNMVTVYNVGTYVIFSLFSIERWLEAKLNRHRISVWLPLISHLAGGGIFTMP